MLLFSGGSSKWIPREEAENKETSVKKLCNLFSPIYSTFLFFVMIISLFFCYLFADCKQSMLQSIDCTFSLGWTSKCKFPWESHSKYNTILPFLWTIAGKRVLNAYFEQLIINCNVLFLFRVISIRMYVFESGYVKMKLENCSVKCVK